MKPDGTSNGKSDVMSDAKADDKSDDMSNDKSDDKSDAKRDAGLDGKAMPSAISSAEPQGTSDDMSNAKPDDKSDAKPERAAARDCVLCGCCLELCPLFAVTNREELSPRAKALLAGPSKFSAATLDDQAVAELAGLCLACGKCEQLCPQGVSVPGLVARLRAEHPDFRQWLWRQWITKLQPCWSLAARGAAFIPEAMFGALTPAGLGLALKGLGGLRPGKGLRPWLTITAYPKEAFQAAHGDRPVVLFDGCVGSGPRQAWARTARFLLRGLGATPVEAAFSCCGSTLGVAGLPEDQERARRANVDAWRKAGRPLVATYCATCRKGLAEYPASGAGLFAGVDEMAAWAASLTPLSALMQGAQAKAGRGAPTVVGWHRPCHADSGGADLRLVSTLLGSRLRTPAKGSCCGFGGIMQLGAPKLSAAVGQACWDGLDKALGFSAAPDVVNAYVLSGCSGCVMQLAATGPKNASVGHWLEIIKTA